MFLLALYVKTEPSRIRLLNEQHHAKLSSNIISDLEQLTPFVTAQIDPRNLDRAPRDDTTYIPGRSRGKAFIEAWKNDNPDEYDSKFNDALRYFGKANEVTAGQSLGTTGESLVPEESYGIRVPIGLKGHNHADAQTHEDATPGVEDVPRKSRRR